MTETRAEKAQRLVDEGRVELVEPIPGYIPAHVQGDHGTYDVILCPGGQFLCTCEWGLVHWYKDDLCAHALAVKLAVEKENKPC